MCKKDFGEDSPPFVMCKSCGDLSCFPCRVAFYNEHECAEERLITVIKKHK